jgi:deoxycytidylate deaminase
MEQIKTIMEQIKTIESAAAESTCQKRVVVCELYDAEGSLLARESNRCSPPNGQCCRIGLVSQKETYAEQSGCNWTHAEEMALNAMPPGSQPKMAIIHGHSFPCPSCEFKLRNAGITDVGVNKHPGTGLRCAEASR